jgi:isopentenyl-diphosphate delta-isomerase
MSEEIVILVDEFDNETGVMEKMEAHRKGELHRAVSVFVFNSEGHWLLHKRASEKYHSGNLWTNACCSHPRPGEPEDEAAHRRLLEEMGLTCELKHQFSFRYRAELDHGLVEHELDHVYIGHTNALPDPDPEEVAEWKYVSTENLRNLLKQHPEHFTEWFKLLFPKVAGGASA